MSALSAGSGRCVEFQPKPMAFFLGLGGHLRIKKRYGAVRKAGKKTLDKSPSGRRDDPEQSRRFIEIAREAEADSSKEEFDRAFKKVAKPRNTKTTRAIRE